MSRTTFVLTRILLLTRLDAGTLQDLLCALFIDDDRGHVNVVPAAHHVADGLLAHAQLQLVLSSRNTSSALRVIVAQCVRVFGLCEGVAPQVRALLIEHAVHYSGIDRLQNW